MFCAISSSSISSEIDETNGLALGGTESILIGSDGVELPDSEVVDSCGAIVRIIVAASFSLSTFFSFSVSFSFSSMFALLMALPLDTACLFLFVDPPLAADLLFPVFPVFPPPLAAINNTDRLCRCLICDALSNTLVDDDEDAPPSPAVRDTILIWLGVEIGVGIGLRPAMVWFDSTERISLSCWSINVPLFSVVVVDDDEDEDDDEETELDNNRLAFEEYIENTGLTT
mmetsp:Transcript_8294/g.14772  ORF Transcript_8294/g.14772 Transcript_8294/m.14772 type:complete len:229 (+) Transcript_8294:1601-2287(+)